MEGPKPKDWEIEHMKPDLEDFTLAEYTEKVILYGFLVVNIATTSSLYSHFYLHRCLRCLLAPCSAHVLIMCEVLAGGWERAALLCHGFF